MKTFAIVYQPDPKRKIQMVKSITEVEDGAEELFEKYPGDRDTDPFVSLYYSSEAPNLKPGDIKPLGYDPLDTDL